MNTLIAAFTLSLSLILAIGAQNAFVLKQGLPPSMTIGSCLDWVPALAPS